MTLLFRRLALLRAPATSPRYRYASTVAMTAIIRKSASLSPPPPAKRTKIDHEERDATAAPPVLDLATQVETQANSPDASDKFSTVSLYSFEDTSEKSHLDFRNGVMLAPMVRSGTLPSRLLALKYGANLVWGPEIVDKAMIGAERVVYPDTGVISFERNGKSIWATHPVEKPYLIYQIGSSTPELAVQAAKIIAQDVSGVELNCGCPKPFSTHSGMGANLLYTPDLLCSILVALRATLPRRIAVSAKIRVLPDQEGTLELVKKIVSTGISCLTVHCRTKDMRMREKAMIGRMRDIVETVEAMGLDIPVIYNGDCLGRADSARVRETTGAHSVMVATAAEKNLSCFSGGQLVDAETVLNAEYLALASYLKNIWGNSKHCLSQFSSPQPVNGQAGRKEFRQMLAKAKDYEAFVGTYDLSSEAGMRVLAEVEQVLAAREAPKEDRVLEENRDSGGELPARAVVDGPARPPESVFVPETLPVRSAVLV